MILVIKFLKCTRNISVKFSAFFSPSLPPLSLSLSLGLTSTSSLGGAGGGDLVALGVADVVNMDVAELDHPKMFTKLFKSILSYRLKEIDFSRVRKKLAT